MYSKTEYNLKTGVSDVKCLLLECSTWFSQQNVVLFYQKLKTEEKLRKLKYQYQFSFFTPTCDWSGATLGGDWLATGTSCCKVDYHPKHKMPFCIVDVVCYPWPCSSPSAHPGCGSLAVSVINHRLCSVVATAAAVTHHEARGSSINPRHSSSRLHSLYWLVWPDLCHLVAPRRNPGNKVSYKAECGRCFQNNRYRLLLLMWATTCGPSYQSTTAHWPNNKLTSFPPVKRAI